MANAKPRVPVMTEMRVTVTRCACLNPEMHKDRPCPQGIADPTATRVVRQYRNPIRQLVWKFVGR